MQYHLTKPARQAVTYARNAAEELGHGYVGTEHLMIGLIRADGGMASAVLTENGVTEDVLLPLIEQLISEDGVDVQDAADYTPRARRVIEMSSREAARLQSDQVGTEHLLMALIKEEDCIAVRLLNTLGVSFQKVYTELLSGMGQSAEKARELFGGRGGRKKNSMLESYTVDLTRMAEEGRLDPVIGREEETA
ncbi:MAG TPA: ATP-dependent Clp protease ATP-binding subunit ClpC, partial [Candidatus Butyricicoccus stercorigallinarum]|nr:ATP-dependent Clp protease ATP-binding subunit ClpC [Candidatus Butyricicoccus stercorigallinarum]